MEDIIQLINKTDSYIGGDEDWRFPIESGEWEESVSQMGSAARWGLRKKVSFERDEQANYYSFEVIIPEKIHTYIHLGLE